MINKDLELIKQFQKKYNGRTKMRMIPIFPCPSHINWVLTPGHVNIDEFMNMVYRFLMDESKFVPPVKIMSKGEIEIKHDYWYPHYNQNPIVPINTIIYSLDQGKSDKLSFPVTMAHLPYRNTMYATEEYKKYLEGNPEDARTILEER